MIKSNGRGTTAKASVTFTLTATATAGAGHAAVCGEWNDWSSERDVMERVEGGFARTIELEPGRTYRFRYLLDGHRWENDWAADWYVSNEFGGDDSVVDLTAFAEAAPMDSVAASAAPPATKAAPPATKAAPKKSVPVKKALATKKAAPAKKAGTSEATNKSEPAEKPAPAKKPAKKTAKKTAE